MTGNTAALLVAYDAQLRTDAEVEHASSVTRLGPLLVARFPGGRGFVTYGDLGARDSQECSRYVDEALALLLETPESEEIEWKTRGHDRTPGLEDALRAHGFAPEEPESIMIGRLEDPAGTTPPPEGVSLRRITGADEIRAMCAMADEAFERRSTPGRADELIARVDAGDPMELWIAETKGKIVSCGRLEPVQGTDFVGFWGGATLPSFRHRGIYRALTAARAQAALARGYSYVHSDCTEFSRPILERSGLVRVSTTTPFLWRKEEARDQR